MPNKETQLWSLMVQSSFTSNENLIVYLRNALKNKQQCANYKENVISENEKRVYKNRILKH